MDLAAGRLLLPVAANALPEALGLADVHDIAPAVLHQVHAGTIGQSLECGVELRGHTPMLGQVARWRWHPASAAAVVARPGASGPSARRPSASAPSPRRRHGG